MPSHNSLSPTPLKRPSITDRNNSGASLSSSNKQTQKGSKVHVVGRSHTRNSSQGKGLNKVGRTNSGANILALATQNHQRQKSGTTLASSGSPKASPIKRNSSNIVLTRNALSHVNLRKNHSAVVLTRNISHPVLKRGGLVSTKAHAKKPKKKAAGFELGDRSSDEDEIELEGGPEWEDTTSQSPEINRHNDPTTSEMKEITSKLEKEPEKPPDPKMMQQEKASSPPPPSPQQNNRSLPDPTSHNGAPSLRPSQQLANPSLLQHNPRSSRAPPAMSSVLAHASKDPLPRNNSSKSFTYITHADASMSKDTTESVKTSSTPGGGVSTSADGGVSHFLKTNTPRDFANLDDSDEDSPSNFLSNYHPQPSTSPEQRRTGSKLTLTHIPSRTQQRLELQRRETMRSSASAPSTPPTSSVGGFGSSSSLPSRSGSQGHRVQSAGSASEAKAVKRDYEAATKQLSVVRRFRNPILEGLNRLKDLGTLPIDTGAVTPASMTPAAGVKRPPSRRGLSNGNISINGGVGAKGLSRSFEEKRTPPMVSRPSSRGRGAAGSGRVHFRRQGSHDDIGLSRSRGSYDEDADAVGEGSGEGEEDGSGLSAEEALLRRMWESREVAF